MKFWPYTETMNPQDCSVEEAICLMLSASGPQDFESLRQECILEADDFADETPDEQEALLDASLEKLMDLGIVVWCSEEMVYDTGNKFIQPKN
ncbi:MAG: hypothetical protein HQL93_04110 [Magnetococcales bacterium]|nr:hypothetical protein [Magnetococcales bacterium]